jgi:hypothetical protein
MAVVIPGWTVSEQRQEGTAMRGIGAIRSLDTGFDIPPQFVVAERRMTGRAIDCWKSGGGGLVDGFAANSLVVVDPAGAAWITAAGDAIGRSFGLAPGMRLDGRAGLACELRAACALVAIDPQPVPFEASLPSPAGGVMLVRAVALPVIDPPADAGSAVPPDQVQFVISWREVLNRAATTRLRRELGAELRLVARDSTRIDPFLREIEK